VVLPGCQGGSYPAPSKAQREKFERPARKF